MLKIFNQHQKLFIVDLRKGARSDKAIVKFYPNFRAASGAYATSLSASTPTESTGVEYEPGGTTLYSSASFTPTTTQRIQGNVPVSQNQAPSKASERIKEILNKQGKKYTEQQGYLIVSEQGRKNVIYPESSSGHPEVIANLPPTATYKPGFEEKLGYLKQKQPVPIYPGSDAAQGQSDANYSPVYENGKVSGYYDVKAQQTINKETLPIRQRYYQEQQIKAPAQTPQNFKESFKTNLWNETGTAENIKDFNIGINQAGGEIFKDLGVSYGYLGKSLIVGAFPGQELSYLFRGMKAPSFIPENINQNVKGVLNLRVTSEDINKAAPAALTTAVAIGSELSPPFGAGAGLYFLGKSGIDFYKNPTYKSAANLILIGAGTATAAKPLTSWYKNYVEGYKKAGFFGAKTPLEWQKLPDVMTFTPYKNKEVTPFAFQLGDKTLIFADEIPQRNLFGEPITEGQILQRQKAAGFPVEVFKARDAQGIKQDVENIGTGELGEKITLTQFKEPIKSEEGLYRQTYLKNPLETLYSDAFRRGFLELPTAKEYTAPKEWKILKESQKQLTPSKAVSSILINTQEKTPSQSIGEIAQLSNYASSSQGKFLTSRIKQYDPFGLSNSRIEMTQPVKESPQQTSIFTGENSKGQIKQTPIILPSTSHLSGLFLDPVPKLKYLAPMLPQEKPRIASLPQSSIVTPVIRQLREPGESQVVIVSPKITPDTAVAPPGLPRVRQKQIIRKPEENKEPQKLAPFSENNKPLLVSIEPAYDVFVRSRGKFSKINKGWLSRSEALKLGSNVVDKSIAATFKLKEVGAIPQENAFNVDLSKFYSKSKDTFVEYAKFRLDLWPEVKQIQTSKRMRWF